jgi:quercetin dioxygenase-like cupin family protein
VAREEMNFDLTVFVGKHDVPMREKVHRAEELMRQHGNAVDIPVNHHFANPGTKRGLYARQITIPKGTVLTGKIHKYEQINFVVKGDISVLTEEGVKRVGAGFFVVSPAGTKRIAYAHKKTVWITVHGTDQTDIDKIESEFIAQTEQEFLEFTKALEAPCPG